MESELYERLVKSVDKAYEELRARWLAGSNEVLWDNAYVVLMFKRIYYALTCKNSLDCLDRVEDDFDEFAEAIIEYNLNEGNVIRDFAEQADNYLFDIPREDMPILEAIHDWFM